MKETVGKVRTVHPEIIKELGIDAATALLKVAHGLRSGLIQDYQFNQASMGDNFIYGNDFIEHMECGTPCCILGWTRAFAAEDVWKMLDKKWCGKDSELVKRFDDLFSSLHPSDPQQAANAVEAFIYDYAEKPWKG